MNYSMSTGFFTPLKTKLGAGLCVKAFVLCLLGFAITACKNTVSIEPLQQQQTLKVITRIGPTTYYQDRHGPTGFEYMLALEFANELGMELEIISVDNLEDIFAALRNNQADIAAAGLSITDERKKSFRFSTPYQNSTPQLIYRSNIDQPKTIDDINNGKLLVVANSSHAEKLASLKKLHPELTWYETSKLDTGDLLEMLELGEIDYTIVDSNEFKVHRAYYRSARVAFDIAAPESIAWIMRKDVNQKLFDSMQKFLKSSKKNGMLAHLNERFFGPAEEVKQIGSRTFYKKMERRLPKYLPMIQKIADEYDMDWRLLAAISYRESHWKPRAKSPTGVRGMMMLTQITAKEMGVTNRLDAEQSLRGGAQYFKKIYKRVASTIEEPDRTWFALASYNVGRGHVEDARQITDFFGDNPNKWVDVKKHLPLLQRKAWYAYTKHGYARGAEPVRYVQHIRHYYDLLSWTYPTEQERLAAKATENLPVELEFEQASIDTNLLAPSPQLSNVL